MNLSIFNTASLFEAATDLFWQLGIKLNSNYSDALKIEEVLKGQRLNTPVYKTIGKTFFIGIIDDSVFKQTGMFDVNYSYKDALQKADKSYDGLMLFALELSKHPNRSEISELTRAFNRISYKMPVALVLKYPMENEDTISISISERFKYKQNWRPGEKAGKVIILRDIKTTETHRGHEDILEDLQKHKATNYEQLHQAWLQVLDVSVLNKKFYEEIFNWYLWASRFVKFPQIRPEKDLVKEDVHQSESLIRLLTRLLFCWFMKEKGLINEHLFKKEPALNILKNLDENESTFYKAILQNLFFATLNKPIEDRKIIDKGWNKKEYGDPLVYRYEELFQHPEKLLSYFENIPFLNGGLFDCLDQKKDKNHSTEIRLDGFSTKAHKQPIVPNKLFFGSYDNVNLSKEYDDKKKTNLKVRGIIDLLSNYKFTIEESTPVEEEIALDPELLGRVFENLLASYNPETKTTARKQTGSFYTPPPIVNYMVDESLLEYLKQKLNDASKENDLRNLIGYTDKKFEFTDAQKQTLIKAINDCRILDPACGSGAFPMGMLQRMIHILKKLDPENKVWLNMVVANFPEYMQHEMRKKLEVENWDYVRKIGIIQECIYGVDIQPIATQISKLRFFISLLVDQKDKPHKPNRGFDPLPNLDFKLVTANTLIAPPETDEVKTGMFAGSEDAFYKEFEKLTARYFSTYKHDEKKKVREEIEKLISNKCSEKIKHIENLTKSPDQKTRKLLQERYKDRIANKENEIALWESYKNLFKQEAVRFFDAKYFFPNVKDGFDIVIGNPPYVSAVSMARTNDEKVYFRNKYPEATGSYDIYVLFLLRALELTSSKGIYSWIIPNKFLIADYSIKTKEKLIKSGLAYSIDVSIYDIFENTSVYPIIIFGNKLYKDKFIEYLLVQYSDLEIRNFAEPIKLKQYASFSDLGVKFSSGATGFEADSLKEYLSENETKNSIPFVVSGCIDKYYYNNINVRFMGLKLDHAFIKYSNRIANSKWNFWMQEKIVIAGMTKVIESVYVKSPLALGVGVYAIYDYGKFNPYFLTAILNSKFLTHYINIRFKDKHLAGGYLAINKSTLEKLPLIIPTAPLEKSIADLSKKILSAKEKNPQADTTDLEKQLDEMVYKLYDLTEEEIKIIEGN